MTSFTVVFDHNTGACNYRTPPPFNCAPVFGVIEPNSTKEVVVSFSPDHQSQFFADTMEIKLNGQIAYTFDIVGQAWVNNMYSILAPKSQLEDDKYKKNLKVKPVPHEYMTASALHSDDNQPPSKALILIFVHHVSSEVEEEVSVDSRSRLTTGKDRESSSKSRTQAQSDTSKAKVVKEVEVGCVKSAQVKKVS